MDSHRPTTPDTPATARTVERGHLPSTRPFSGLIELSLPCADPFDGHSDSDSLASDSEESFALYSGSEDEEEGWNSEGDGSEDGMDVSEETAVLDRQDMLHESFEQEVETEGTYSYQVQQRNTF